MHVKNILALFQVLFTALKLFFFAPLQKSPFKSKQVGEFSRFSQAL